MITWEREEREREGDRWRESGGSVGYNLHLAIYLNVLCCSYIATKFDLKKKKKRVKWVLSSCCGDNRHNYKVCGKETVRCYNLDMHGVEAVEQQQYEGVQHLE